MQFLLPQGIARRTGRRDTASTTNKSPARNFGFPGVFCSPLMNHLYYPPIPDEIHAAAHQLHDYATRQGWGGLKGNGMWAFHGIGNIDAYNQRIYDLEAKLRHLEEAFINADRLRTTYQLQVETLHNAILALEQARGRYHTQKACEALLALALTQRTANQP